METLCATVRQSDSLNKEKTPTDETKDLQLVKAGESSLGSSESNAENVQILDVPSYMKLDELSSRADPISLDAIHLDEHCSEMSFFSAISYEGNEEKSAASATYLPHMDNNQFVTVRDLKEVLSRVDDGSLCLNMKDVNSLIASDLQAFSGFISNDFLWIWPRTMIMIWNWNWNWGL